MTPVSRRHIATLAREVSTLDRLARGQLIFDEGLDVLDALWSGQPVEHRGVHFTVSTDGFAPPVERAPANAPTPDGPGRST